MFTFNVNYSLDGFNLLEDINTHQPIASSISSNQLNLPKTLNNTSIKLLSSYVDESQTSEKSFDSDSDIDIQSIASSIFSNPSNSSNIINKRIKLLSLDVDESQTSEKSFDSGSDLEMEIHLPSQPHFTTYSQPPKQSQVIPKRTPAESIICLKNAIKKSAKIRKGILELERRNIKPNILIQSQWIEMIDPLHRSQEYLKKHFEKWEEDKTTKLSFEIWENLHFPLPENYKTIDQFSDFERRNFILNIKQNTVFDKDGEIYNTSNCSTFFSGTGIAIFVIGPDDTIYCGRQELSVRHHTSYSGGGAVIGAGEIRTNEKGKILFLSNQSGHYQPTLENTLEMLRAFERKEINLALVEFKEITPKKENIFYSSAKKYLDTKGKCLPSKYMDYKIETDQNGKITHITHTLYENKNSNSKNKTRHDIMKTLHFLQSRASLSDVKLHVVTSLGNITYSATEYLSKADSAIPLECEFGTIECNEQNEITMIKHKFSYENTQSTLYLKKFLQTLKGSGVNISKIKVDFEQEGNHQIRDGNTALYC